LGGGVAVPFNAAGGLGGVAFGGGDEAVVFKAAADALGEGAAP